MSAIWGAVQMQGVKIPAEKAKKMKEVFVKYKIDRIEEYVSDNVILGCGIQYFTKESRYEKLPCTNEREGIYFTADVMLDNREELLRKIDLKKEDISQISDGEILYEMYKTHGNECLNSLLGAYAFVYYNQKENTIYIVSDATGNRCLYYKYENGIFEFSTVIEALLEDGEKEEINERWVVDFLALDNLAGMTECEETIYKNIKKIEPAHVVKITGKGIEKECYWKPNPKELRLKTDAEYKEKLIEKFGEAVNCLLRSEETAMMLSGGLDSSSIACFAAPELKKQGKKLYTFTSIPEAGYVSDMNSYNVTNESEKVEKTARFLGNLECHYIDLAGMDAWTSHYEELKCIEIPYKSAQNLLWILESMQKAYELNARVILNGGYGNVTISAGNIETYLNTLLSQGRFVSYIKECQCFARKFQFGRRKKYKAILGTAYSYFCLNKHKNGKKEEAIGNAYLTKEIIEKYSVYEKFSKIKSENSYSKMNIKKMRKLMKGDIQFSHKGEVETKHSLKTGVIFRDPCMDKRVIEFCMSLPVEQFCYRGVSRRLVREHFEGIVPDHIIKKEDYGYQGADLMMKVERNWKEISESIKKVYERNRDNKIVDVDRALKDLETLGGELYQSNYFDFLRLTYTAMVLEVMEKEKK